jgi:hypothetical protein
VTLQAVYRTGNKPARHKLIKPAHHNSKIPLARSKLTLYLFNHNLFSPNRLLTFVFARKRYSLVIASEAKQSMHSKSTDCFPPPADLQQSPSQ